MGAEGEDAIFNAGGEKLGGGGFGDGEAVGLDEGAGAGGDCVERVLQARNEEVSHEVIIAGGAM